jgi:hypothetical protein
MAMDTSNSFTHLNLLKDECGSSTRVIQKYQEDQIPKDLSIKIVLSKRKSEAIELAIALSEQKAHF